MKDIESLIDKSSDQEEKALEKLLRIVEAIPSVLDHSTPGVTAIDIKGFKAVWDKAGGEVINLDNGGNGGEIQTIKEIRLEQEKERMYRQKLAKLQSILNCAQN